MPDEAATRALFSEAARALARIAPVVPGTPDRDEVADCSFGKCLMSM
jgi:hypothetical protein